MRASAEGNHHLRGETNFSFYRPERDICCFENQMRGAIRKEQAKLKAKTWHFAGFLLTLLVTMSAHASERAVKMFTTYE